MTYCINKDCPFPECEKHLDHLTGEEKNLMVAAYDGVCGRYLGFLLDEIDKNIEIIKVERI